MRASSLAGAFIISLLVATALTPVRAADMTNERTLNPQREPQNSILHHGNYQGHRYSLLKEINADTGQEPQTGVHGGAAAGAVARRVESPRLCRGDILLPVQRQAKKA